MLLGAENENQKEIEVKMHISRLTLTLVAILIFYSYYHTFFVASSNPYCVHYGYSPKASVEKPPESPLEARCGGRRGVGPQHLLTSGEHAHHIQYEQRSLDIGTQPFTQGS